MADSGRTHRYPLTCAFRRSPAHCARCRRRTSSDASAGSRQHVHGALDTAGKRAAFALYYAPLHFIAVTEVVQALRATESAPSSIIDLGCGTGAAGAAWALAVGSTPTVTGIDRHPWAVSEARWTFSQLGMNGYAKQGDVDRVRASASRRERRSPPTRSTSCQMPHGHASSSRLCERAQRGGHVLILEPLARGVAPWWPRHGTARDRARRPGRRVEAERGGSADRAPARHGRRTQLPASCDFRSLFL